MSGSAKSSVEDLESLALGKMTRVLGPGARRVYDAVLRDAGLGGLASADDLYLFASKLSARGGFEGAVGGLLSVAAVMRGATATPPPADGATAG